jgi:hypothetical protein
MMMMMMMMMNAGCVVKRMTHSRITEQGKCTSCAQQASYGVCRTGDYTRLVGLAATFSSALMLAKRRRTYMDAMP